MDEASNRIGVQYYTLSSSSRRRGSTTVASWWVSFGDLLTLLLCFFLALVGFGTLRISVPATLSNEPGRGNSELGQAKFISQGDGTPFALYESEPVVVSLRYAERDYAADQEMLTAEAAGKLKTEVSKSPYDITAVHVETCATVPGKGAGHSWLHAMSRGMALRSQVFDAGVSAELITLRVLGGHCEVLGAGIDEAPVVSQITVLKRPIQDGGREKRR